jgi:hypothetical protein
MQTLHPSPYMPLQPFFIILCHWYTMETPNKTGYFSASECVIYGHRKTTKPKLTKLRGFSSQADYRLSDSHLSAKLVRIFADKRVSHFQRNGFL